MTRPGHSAVHDRYATRIVDETARLASAVEGADATAPVPGCPGWSLAHLLRHVGGAHRWAEAIVRTRATAPVSDDQVNDVTPGAEDDLAGLVAWLTEGAARLADTLRATDPDVPVWTVAPGGTPRFWARRMTCETVVHRCDAAAAVGGAFALDADVALDGLDEWMEFSTLPQAYESDDARRELLGPAKTIHIHATDAPEATGEWLIDLTGEPITWSRTHEGGRRRPRPVGGPAACHVPAPLADPGRDA